MYSILLFVFSLGLMLLEIPVAVSLFIAASMGYFIMGAFWPWWYSISFLTSNVTSKYIYMVIPLFLLMGQMSAKSSINKILSEGLLHIFGRFKAGIGIATILAATMFGAICGSSIATISSLGPVFHGIMRKNGYSKELTFGVIAAGGTLGILIPPSIVLVVYAISTQESIDKLFIAAFPLSMIAVAGYLISTVLYIRLNKDAIISLDDAYDNITKSKTIAPNVMTAEPNNSFHYASSANLETQNISSDMQTLGRVNLIHKDDSASTSHTDKARSYFNLGIIVLIFSTVLYGMYSGILTPNEAASAIVVIVTIYKIFFDQGKKKWFEIFDATAKSTGMLIFIFIGAGIFNSALALMNFPSELTEFVMQYKEYPRLIIIFVVLLFLFLGCIMDGLAIVLLFAPMLHPIITSLDLGIPKEYSGIWFGVMMLMVVEVSVITPPVGMNLFVIKQSIKELNGVNVFKAVKYFLVSDIFRIVLLIFYPEITLLLLR